MLSAIPNTLGMSLKVSSILHWNMLPAGTALKGKCFYLYLPNGQANVVKYDNCLSNLILWYSELASMMDMYCTLLSFGSISLSVGPLCISLINAWLSCTGSKHSHALPFALGTTTKLLHHSAVLSTPRGAMMSSSCSHFSSSLNSSVMHMPHALVALGMACCWV